MKTLFIDTHSEKITMILKDEDKIITKEEISNRSHSEIAIPTLDSLLKETGIKAKDIDEIIVVNGPGSFTGVRIGVTIAKTIAYSFNIPIKTITSLEMYGVSASSDFDLVSVPDPKGMYFAKFENNNYFDFSYMKKRDYEEMVKSNNLRVLESQNIDINKIIDYLKDKKSVNSHLVNPIYIKEIDALK